MSTLKQRIASNTWDSINDVLAVLKRTALPLGDSRRWAWHRNQNCKYIDVRIDMRDGGCIIKNQEGQRISPAQLNWQYSKEKTPNYPDENFEENNAVESDTFEEKI